MSNFSGYPQYSTVSVSFGLEKQDAIYNVKAFGARGNGSADDTDDILRAYNAIPAGGGTLYFPKGTYIVRGVDSANGGIVIKKSHTTLIFDAGAILKLKDSPLANQGSCLQIADYGDTSVRGTVTDIKVIGVTVDGNKTNQKNGSGASDGTNSGIGVEDATNVLIEHFDIYDCDGYGIGNIGSNLPHRGNITLQHGKIHGNHYDGVDFKAGIFGYTMRDVYSYNNGYGGNIAGRDGMGFDLRGNDGLIDNCVAGRDLDNNDTPNASGNFRIRENAGRFCSIQNSHSYNSTTYGFNLIGGNTGLYQLSNCSSYNDSTGFRLRIGHYKLIGCQATFSGEYGYHIQEDSNGANVITTTTMIVPQTKQTLDITVAAATNLAAGMFIRISDGTYYIEGVIKKIVRDTLTVLITSNFGGADVASGANVTERNYGSVSLLGCSASYCGTDGITILSTPYHVMLSNCEFSRNGRYGVKVDANNITIRDSRLQNNLKALYLNNMTANRVYIDNNEMNDDQTDKTQGYAFDWTGGGNTSCTGSIQWNYLVGNATGITTGTRPVGITYANNIEV